MIIWPPSMKCKDLLGANITDTSSEVLDTNITVTMARQA
jgi:hypothetical protein